MTTDRDLPIDLELPLSSGEPWWYWLGGRPSLDFVNTLRERWNRRVETLVIPGDLAAWLVRAEVVPERQRVTRAHLQDARALREAIDGCVTAIVEGAPVPPEAIERLDFWLVRAGTRPELHLGVDGLPVLSTRSAAESPRRALGQIAMDAAEMLGTPASRARIRVCASDTCSARFFDRSPAGKRRWCSMRTCGNEAKVRAHRARVKGAA